MQRDIITLGLTANWFARAAAANQTKPGPLFYQDEMGSLDAPDWIPAGGVTVTPNGESVLIHCVQR